MPFPTLTSATTRFVVEASSLDAAADGTAIATATDSSGNNRPLQQATATARPILKKGASGINGKSVLRFDGVDDYMVEATSPNSYSAVYTRVMVFKVRALDGDLYLFGASREYPSGISLRLTGGVPQLTDTGSGEIPGAHATDPLTVGAAYVAMLTYTPAGALTLRINNTVVISTTTDPSGPGQNGLGIASEYPSVGDQPNGAGFAPIDVALVADIDGNVNTTDSAAIHSYVAAQYAIAVATSGNTAPTATLTASKTTGVEPGELITLTAGGSDADGTLTADTLTQTVGPTVAVTMTDAAHAVFEAPYTLAGTTVTFSRTVTDDAGAVSAPVSVSVAVLAATERHVITGGTTPVEVPLRTDIVTTDDHLTGFTWSGRSWVAQQATAVVPGPNTFAAAAANVRIDGTDLVLGITKRSGAWQCAAVQGTFGSLGYGRYVFVWADDPTLWDVKTVFGMFTYSDSISEALGSNELDVQISKWGYAEESSRVWYTAQPTAPTRRSDHRISPNAPYTSTMIWQAGQVHWSTVDNSGNVLGEHFCTDTVPVPSSETVRLNLWLINGEAPAGGRGQEVRVKSFAFTAGITKTIPKAATVTDGFTDPHGWALRSGAAITGGQLVIPCAAGSATAYTGAVVDLTNSGIQTNTVGVPAVGNGTCESSWSLRWDADNYVAMLVAGASLFWRVRQGGVNTQGSTTYNATAHKHWRIEHSGSNILFRAAPDGTTWTTLTTQATTLGTKLARLSVQYACGRSGTETTPAPFVIESLG